MHDLPEEPDVKNRYECLQCGELLLAETHPLDCPECGSVMQGLKNSLE